MTEQALEDALDPRLVKYANLPDEWQAPELAAELERVVRVAERRQAVLDALSRAESEVIAAENAVRYQLDSEIANVAELAALERIASGLPDDVIDRTPFAAIQRAVLVELNGFVTPMAASLPAHAYRVELAAYQALGSQQGVDPPVRTELDATAIAAVDAGLPALDANFRTLQSLHDHQSIADVLDWLTAAAFLRSLLAVDDRIRIDEMTAAIEAANAYRIAHKLTWLPPDPQHHMPLVYADVAVYAALPFVDRSSGPPMSAWPMGESPVSTNPFTG